MPATEQVTVLVIDDDRADREAVVRALRGVYRVVGAQTAREGLSLFESEHPRCTLVDYRLPDMDGLALSQELAGRGSALVMMTGWGDEQLAIRALKGCVHDYIPKGETLPDTLHHAVALAIERRDAEEQLALYQQLLERMPIGICVLDLPHDHGAEEFSCRWQSPTLAVLSAMNHAPAPESTEDLVRSLLGTRGLRMCRNALLSGQPQTAVNLRFPDGPSETQSSPLSAYEIKAVPLSGTQVAVFVNDITDIVRAEEKHAELERQIRASQRMDAVGRLAGGIAHDFNNLLTVIDSYASFLIDDPSCAEEGVRNDLGMIRKAASRAAKLTDQLLAFSRKQPQRLATVNLNGVVAELEGILKRTIGEDIELVSDLCDDLGSVRTDSAQIEQVLLNLALNARDAMQNGGRLGITTGNVGRARVEQECPDAEVSDDEYVMLAVEDNGTGMDESTRRRVFEPFFTTKQVSKGTGLGLSTVYGIVKQNNGFVTVASTPGSGTVFRVFLPRVALRTKTDGSARKELAACGGNETILIVEDEELVRTVAARILRKEGYDVREATGVDDAQAAFEDQNTRIDLLLTDIVMPGMNGLELAERVKASGQRLKVAYMSGYADRMIVQEVLEGPAIYIHKPFTPNALLTGVRAALDQEETAPPGS